MASLVILDQKSPEATVPGVFDFSSLFTSGQTLGALTVAASVWAGVDVSPQFIVGATTTSGLVVTVMLTGGIAGVIYKLRVSAAGSDGSTQVLVGYLAVVENPL